MSDLIAVDLLRRLIRLGPETGRLYWLPRPREMFATQRAFLIWNVRFAGKEAVSVKDTHGYRRISIFGQKYQMHRVVFALHHGRWPLGQVDHADCDRVNNRPSNLREATSQDNQRNRLSGSGTSRFKGVSWHKTGGRWAAQTKVNGKSMYLGLFTEEAEAARAYDKFARHNFGDFARLNFPEAS